jgi:hypothetical protein
MSCVNIDEILEEAKWEAEFGEGRYIASGATSIWIRRINSGPDMVCRFDSVEKAYNFGCMFLLKHCPDYTVGGSSYYNCVIGYNSKVRVEMCVGVVPAGAKIVTPDDAFASAHKN